MQKENTAKEDKRAEEMSLTFQLLCLSLSKAARWVDVVKYSDMALAEDFVFHHFINEEVRLDLRVRRAAAKSCIAGDDCQEGPSRPTVDQALQDLQEVVKWRPKD